MSFRNYWSVGDLLQDVRYWKNAYPEYNREKAYASWRVLRMKWGIPNHLTVDEYVQQMIEGHKPRGPVSGHGVGNMA